MSLSPQKAHLKSRRATQSSYKLETICEPSAPAAQYRLSARYIPKFASFILIYKSPLSKALPNHTLMPRRYCLLSEDIQIKIIALTLILSNAPHNQNHSM